jgi:uncharacterized membrane protein YhhN
LPAGTCLALIVCTLAVGGLLVAEWRGSLPGKWLAKPAASASFVFAALTAGAADSAYGRWIVAALVLCLVGDVLLIPERRARIFRAGIVAFLVGHLAYVAAFLTQPLAQPIVVAAAVALGVAFGFVWRWLSPRLAADVRGAVATYLIVIGAMSALACGLSAAGGPATVAIGALAFATSDVSVARDRFVQHAFHNRAWGLPLYYAAQLMLALSPASIA